MKKLKIYLNYISYFIACLIPKKKNLWVFGAWFGERISDNSYALYLYVKEHFPAINAVWIANNIQDGEAWGIPTYRRNRFKAIWTCLRAGVSVMNQGYLDFGELNWIHRCFKVQLWHGVPWKKIGEDSEAPKYGLLHRISHRTYIFANKCDLYIVSSDECRKVWKTAFKIDDSKIINAGLPRNDILYKNDKCREIRSRIEKKMNIEGKTIVLYMPTFRDKSANKFSFHLLTEQQKSDLQKKNIVILEKQHFVDQKRNHLINNEAGIVKSVVDLDSQELLAIADLLITDYSSCYFDYLVRNKPIIHYLYDYDKYKDDDRGLYYDKEYVTAGDVVYTETELLHSIDENIKHPDNMEQQRSLIRNRFITYDDPFNSKTICDEIIKRTM